jgi:hypothetical protein
MKTKTRKTDQGREGRPPPTVSLCPRDLNPTFEYPHRIGKPPSPRSKNGLGGGDAFFACFQPKNAVQPASTIRPHKASYQKTKKTVAKRGYQMFA